MMTVPRVIHIFNPETDLALGSDHHSYTPPAQIRSFRDTLALLPALFAREGDAIAVSADALNSLETLPLYHEALSDGIEIVGMRDIISCLKPGDCIEPWGWNRQLRNRLLTFGISENNLPSQKELDIRRGLSHRKTTIDFYRFSSRTEFNDFVPEMFTDEEDAYMHTSAVGDCCLKSPWSSSGRGVAFTKGMSGEQIRNWLHGAIRSQGSVMVERSHPRALDCASEWRIDTDGKTIYEGLSVFVTSERGKYRHNLIAPEEDLKRAILSKCNDDENLRNIIELQNAFIVHMIAPHYHGPLGIDMMVTGDGRIVPCVEINLRNTMGHVAVEIESRISSGDTSSISNHLRSLCSDGIFSTDLLLK